MNHRQVDLVEEDPHMDQGWHASTESTRATLEAAGITPRVDLIRGQGHVLRLDDRILMDWLDEVLSGP